MKNTKSSKNGIELINENCVYMLMKSGFRISEVCNKESICLSCHNADIKVGSNSFRHNYTSNRMRHIVNSLDHVSINMTAKYINKTLK